MNEILFLSWVRGTGFQIASSIFVLGVLWRLIEIYGLGRKKDLAVPRKREGASGWHTIFRRSLAPPGMIRVAPLSYIAGYAFHVGLLVVILLFAPHILIFKSVFGFGWPGIPSQIIDALTVVTLAAMLVVLFDRIRSPVKRFLSTFGDYFAWAITFLPVLTGYLAVKHLLLPYTTMLAIHILSVELFLVMLPFTKLIHTFTVFVSRWYNGDISGRKGVAV